MEQEQGKYDRSSYEPQITYHIATYTEAYRNGDLKTERMWMEEGYRINPGAKPCRMWRNRFHVELSDYYFREDVHLIQSEDIFC